jgi:hypothetical protein
MSGGQSFRSVNKRWPLGIARLLSRPTKPLQPRPSLKVVQRHVAAVRAGRLPGEGK